MFANMHHGGTRTWIGFPVNLTSSLLEVLAQEQAASAEDVEMRDSRSAVSSSAPALSNQTREAFDRLADSRSVVSTIRGDMASQCSDASFATVAPSMVPRNTALATALSHPPTVLVAHSSRPPEMHPSQGHPSPARVRPFLSQGHGHHTPTHGEPFASQGFSQQTITRTPMRQCTIVWVVNLLLQLHSALPV